MAAAERSFRVVVADDFGYSSTVNEAVAKAHDNGVLTSASIMAGGKAFEEALVIARKRRSLSIGLHVTLCDGAPVLDPSEIPGLAGKDGVFIKSAALAWMRFIFKKGLLEEARREIEAQFEKLCSYGIRPAHVDGHHHMHMHPGVFRIICEEARKRQVRWIRIPGERLGATGALRRGLLPVAERLVFAAVGGVNRKTACAGGLLTADAVYGLAGTGRMDEKRLVEALKKTGRITEVFTHPDTKTACGRAELAALTSMGAREAVKAAGAKLAGYGDLTASLFQTGPGAEMR